MGFFKRFSSKVDLQKAAAEQEAAEQAAAAAAAEQAVPEPPDIFTGDNSVICHVRSSWEWVIEEIQKDMTNLAVVEKEAELPTGLLAAANGKNGSATTTPVGRRGRRKKLPGPCSLRLEIKNESGDLIEAVHGTSEAFDGLEDKDELFRTMQRCRCENLELSPPSRLLNWDVTKEECMNLVGESLPSLKGNKDKEKVAVLKEPMGSSGTGVFFVTTAQEIHEIIEEHRKRVQNSDFLDNLIAAKGRIPSWVLQAEIAPCLLIRGRRKFHIRTYVACVERIDHEEILQTYVYNRHEIRVAGESVPENEADSRDRTAHITNGAHSSRTERDLLNNEPELVKRGLQEKIELFVAQLFDQHIVNDIVRRVSMSITDDAPARKFVVGGLDLMVTDDNRLYLLEVNVNPAAPARDTVTEDFHKHLRALMGDLMGLVAGKPSVNFVPCSKILDRKP